MQPAFVVVRTLVIAAIGGFAFDHAGLPAPYLSGAILASAVAALGGVTLSVPDRLRNLSYYCVGVIIGATVDSETLQLLPRWPVSMAALAIAMALILIVLPAYFRLVHGLDRPTARLSSIPGAMSQVIALTDDLDVDARRVLILHALRLIILMLLIPMAVWMAMPTDAPMSPSAPIMTLTEIALLTGVSVLGLPVARALRIPSPYFTGPMLVAAILAASGAVSGSLPEPVIAAAFIVMGAIVGTQFSGVSRAYLVSCLGIGLGGILVAIGVTVLVAWPTAVYLDLPFIQIWLALAPGGFDTMAALALSLGVDPAFVAGHQFMRLLGLFAAIPFLFRDAKRSI